MSWFNFILSIPFVGVGYIWAWMCDMFQRGRVLYGLSQVE